MRNKKLKVEARDQLGKSKTLQDHYDECGKVTGIEVEAWPSSQEKLSSIKNILNERMCYKEECLKLRKELNVHNQYLEIINALTRKSTLTDEKDNYDDQVVNQIVNELQCQLAEKSAPIEE